MRSRRHLKILLILGLLYSALSVILVTPAVAQDVQAISSEWTQDAGNAQRTGYIAEEPLEPWTLLWTWNGPDANGGSGGHLYNAPSEARTVTGGSYVYAPAGGSGLYALAKENGRQGWRVTATSFNATPAYETASGYLFAGGADGKLYKIDARNGSVVAIYNAGNPLNKSILLVNGFVFAVTDSGQLHKVNTASMAAAWVYSANAPIATPPSYSASRDMLVYATNDLYVHGVNNGNGSQRWRVKPTPNSAGFPNEMDGMWPVIAEQHGVVFVRMRLNHDAGLWGGPGTGGMYPNTTSETRAFLQNNPQLKNLFALSLDTGSEAFIPAVGYGGVETLVNNQAYLDIGPVPVIKILPDGKEVAYVMFRSGASNPPDGRWDSHFGEMVLDNQTIPGLAAGDVRFVSFPNSYLHITDEQTPYTMAGNTVFRAHWGASEQMRIVDRSNTRGLTYNNPITVQSLPTVIRRMTACGSPNTTTHWATCGLDLFDDGKYWTGPGWWVYWNILDPPTPHRSAYSEGLLPRYTYASGGLIVVEGNGGDLFVLRHSGSAAPAPTIVPTIPAQPTAIPTNPPPPTMTPVQSSGTPQVTSVAANSPQVGRYEKYEVTFQINKSYPANSMLPYYYYDPSDPRGVDGITIDGHFITPSGQEQVVPAFYHQQYTGTGTQLTATNVFSWKLRFAPQETGSYSYYITITDRNGTTRHPENGTLAFTSTESNRKGFVRASTRDSRFLEYSNGESFVPISSGHQWWAFGQGRSLDFERTFEEYARYGINLTRIWDQNDGYGLTVEGHFDAYNYPDDFNPVDRGIDIGGLPKGTQMNQRGNYEEDRIIEAAERNGVQIILGSHGDPFWIWDASVYNESWNTNPVAFDDPAHLRYWQRNFRYRVARWGYSTAVMAWEVWNEHGHVSSNSGAYRFYQSYGQYQLQTDPYRHLRTTSQGSQAWSPEFWSSPAFDIASYHDYMMISRYSADLTYDAANFVYRFAQCLRTANARSCGLGLGDGSTWNGPTKPIFWGELDTGTTQWNQANINAKATHDVRWAGLFSPIGMAPIDWYWDQQSAAFIATKHAEAGIASRYFQGVDYAGLNFTYLSTDDVRNTSQSIAVSDAKLRVLGMRAANGAQAFAWVQNRDNARWDQGVNNNPLNATFTINQMASGNYRVEIWDTYTGQVTDGGVVAANNGAVTVQVNNLTKDVAVKIISTTQQPPATPIPTMTTAPTMTPLPTEPPVQPTATPLPTEPPVQPTATPLPTEPPVSTNPGLLLAVVPASANLGETVSMQLNLNNVSNLYGLQVNCAVDPTILGGMAHQGSEGFNDGNGIFVDQGYQAGDGTWRVATTRIKPNGPIEGSMMAFSLTYLVQAAGVTPITCSVLGVDSVGRDVPLEIGSALFTGIDNSQPPVEPTQPVEPTVPVEPTQPTEPTVPVEPTQPVETATPIATLVPFPTLPVETPTLLPTVTPQPPTPGALSTIMGMAQIPGADDHSGVTIGIYSSGTVELLVELVTGPNGSFQFTDVPANTYVLMLKAPQSLTLAYMVTVTGDGQVLDLGQAILPMGDVDANSTINVQDAALVGANFGLDSALVPNANLNRDVRIDIRDLVLIGSNFNLTSPVTGQ